MVQFLRKVADSPRFQNFITFVILFAGVLVGCETYPALVESHGTILHLLDKVVLAVFVVEIVVKMGAEGRRPWRYFTDGWNVFDFIIVAAAFLPVGSQYVTVLRLARLLRVLKLVRALPRLQLLVSALLKSIPSMAYVSVLLGLLFYIYGVAAVFIFGENDPIHFGNLQIAMVSLFRAVTLEDWTDLMYIQMFGCDNYGYAGNEALCTKPHGMPVIGAIFFISFVMIGTMIVLNLFIGVIMNGMSEAQEEAEELAKFENADEGGASLGLDSELQQLNKQLAQMQQTVQGLAVRASMAPPPPTSARSPSGVERS